MADDEEEEDMPPYSPIPFDGLTMFDDAIGGSSSSSHVSSFQSPPLAQTNDYANYEHYGPPRPAFWNPNDKHLPPLYVPLATELSIRHFPRAEPPVIPMKPKLLVFKDSAGHTIHKERSIAEPKAVLDRFLREKKEKERKQTMARQGLTPQTWDSMGTEEYLLDERFKNLGQRKMELEQELENVGPLSDHSNLRRHKHIRRELKDIDSMRETLDKKISRLDKKRLRAEQLAPAKEAAGMDATHNIQDVLRERSLGRRK